MIRASILAVALLSASPVMGQTITERVALPVRVQLDAVPTGALVTMLMRDVLRVPYVIAPDVLADTKPMSVNLVMPRSELHALVVGFLRGSGFAVQLKGGTVFVSKRPIAGLPEPLVYSSSSFPTGSPLTAPVAVPTSPAPLETVGGGQLVPSIASSDVRELAPTEPKAVSVVTPAYRSVGELAEIVETVFPDIIAARRAVSEPDGGRIVDVLEPDQLVLTGEADQLDRAEELIAQLDRSRPVVEIRAVIFEVRTSRARNSALSLLASVLDGRVEVGSGSLTVPGEQFIRIAAGGLRAVLSATRGDGRFNVVAEPTLSASSGTVARINSGSQVPTIGSVSFAEDGTPIRSVEYRDSGVSLTVRPTVRLGEIELALEQERSTFVQTTTGVNDSPTLNKASSSARVTIRPGETLVLAGLDETADADRRQGFFGGLIGSRSNSNDSSQLLVVVQADVAPAPSQTETQFYRLSTPVDDEAHG